MKIFISYSSIDQSFREDISETLEDLDHIVWADKSLKSGQQWWSEIVDEIRKADVFITLLSKNYDTSDACELELNYATALNKYVLPIKIEKLSNELLPYELSKLQVLDYFSLSATKRITGIVNALTAIKSEADFPRSNPTHLPDEPAIPVSYKTRIFNRLDGDLELDSKIQKEIIAELRSAIANNQGDHTEIKLLLEKMLKRGDEISLNISKEINELVEKIKPRRIPVPEPTPVDEKAESEYFKTSKKKKENANSVDDDNEEEGLSIGLQIVSFLIPVVGVVLFFIYKNEERAKANRGLILAIVGFVLYLIIDGIGGGGSTYP